jgi:hypothetical protein
MVQEIVVMVDVYLVMWHHVRSATAVAGTRPNRFCRGMAVWR